MKEPTRKSSTDDVIEYINARLVMGMGSFEDAAQWISELLDDIEAGPRKTQDVFSSFIRCALNDHYGDFLHCTECAQCGNSHKRSQKTQKAGL